MAQLSDHPTVKQFRAKKPYSSRLHPVAPLPAGRNRRGGDRPHAACREDRSALEIQQGGGIALKSTKELVK